MANNPTAIKSESTAGRPRAERHDSRDADSRCRIPDICTENPRNTLPSIILVRRSMAAASSGQEDWRKCHEVNLRRLGNADLEEVAFAEKGISAILVNVDLSLTPRDAADAAMCLLGRCARELAEATESYGNMGNDEPTR